MITLEYISSRLPAEVVQTRNHDLIATELSIGRTKLASRDIGIGTILETIGLTEGNAFLDFIFTNPDFKYVKVLIENGTLNIGSSLVQQTIDGLVAATVLSNESGEKLKALGVVEDRVSPMEVAAAFERGY